MKRQSKAALAKRKLVKAYLDDDSTLIQLIDMAAESGAYEEPSGGWKVTKQIEREVTKFERDLQKALDQWTKKRPLKGMFTTNTLMDANGGYLVFMTLRGEGVGIWDGDWDEYFEDPKKDIKDLEKFLEQKLRKYADDTGGGSLNQAIDDAAYEQAYGAEASASITGKQASEIVKVLAKAGHKALALRFGRDVLAGSKKPAVAATEFFVVVADGDPNESYAGESLEEALDAAMFDSGTRYTVYKVMASDAGDARMPYSWKKGKVVKKAIASFKGAVPGNLADNTKPNTPQSQKQAVELLKQGGILPEGEKAADYPVLTAQVKKEIIATLLKRKQPKLATWASRNLKVQAAKNYASVVFLQNDHDFNDFSGSGGRGQEGFFDSSEKEMLKYLQQWDYGDNYGDIVDPMMQKGSNDYTYKKGPYVMTYNPGLGYAGLYVKAPIGAATKRRKKTTAQKKSLAAVGLSAVVDLDNGKHLYFNSNRMPEVGMMSREQLKALAIKEAKKLGWPPKGVIHFFKEPKGNKIAEEALGVLTFTGLLIKTVDMSSGSPKLVKTEKVTADEAANYMDDADLLLGMVKHLPAGTILKIVDTGTKQFRAYETSPGGYGSIRPLKKQELAALKKV